MTLKHWIWIFSGLLAWALLTVLWMTSPDVCDLPEAAGSPHCLNR